MDQSLSVSTLSNLCANSYLLHQEASLTRAEQGIGPRYIIEVILLLCSFSRIRVSGFILIL